MNEPTYLFCVTPPKDTQTVLSRIQQRYPEYNRYRIRPHITLYPPFLILQDHAIKELMLNIEPHFKSVGAQKITLNSLGTFRGTNNVVFAKPDKSSTDYLSTLARIVRKYIPEKTAARYPDYTHATFGYHPHLTLAERIPQNNLSETKNNIAKQFIACSFTVKSIDLYVRTKQRATYIIKAQIPLKAAKTSS